MKISPETIRKILVIQLRAIGDVILTTPVFPVLKEHFSFAEIHFVTGKGIHELISGIPGVDGVFSMPESGFEVLSTFNFFRQVRSRHYDLVIDYQCTPGTALLTWVTGAPYRLGWKLGRRQWAYNLFSTANVQREYVSVQKCRALTLVGIDRESRELQVSIPEESFTAVNSYFRDKNIERNRLLVNITPRGKRPARQWIPEKIARLSDILIEKYNAVVFYNLASGDENYARSVARLARHPIHLLPIWPISTFTAFLKSIDLHISYDNGPKHLAMAVGTPTISLFATDYPDLWNPLNDPEHPFILSPVPCRFCRLKECPIMICMKDVEVVEVLEKMHRIPTLQARLNR